MRLLHKSALGNTTSAMDEMEVRKLALSRMVQVNMDLGVFHKTNLMDVI